MKTLLTRLRRQGGLTLVELLIAMVISLVLLGGMHRLFVGSTTNYAVTDQLSRIQENGRFASHILQTEIMSAGYLGCLQDISSMVNTLNNPDYFIYNFDQAIYGLEATGANTWADDSGVVNPAATGAADMGLVSPLSGSDILVIRGIAPNLELQIVQEMQNQAANLHVTPGVVAVTPGDILLVTDCEGAAVFQVTGYQSTSGSSKAMVHNTATSEVPGNAVKNLGHTFAEGSNLYFPQIRTYYIRNNAANEPSLYYKVGAAAAEELIEGVENMQIRYGEDTDDDLAADVYRAANAVNDWENVVSVRVGLLMRSPQTIAQIPVDTAQYDVDGDGAKDFDPADDKRLRLVMINTVGIRNRLR